MLEDKIKSSTKIEKGDSVYIYPYKIRNSIESFEELSLITVEEIDRASHNGKDIIVSGFFEDVDEDGRIYQNKETGIVAYKCQGDLVITSDGLKYVSYYANKNRYSLCLKKIKDLRIFYRLVLTFSVAKDIVIKIRPYEKLLFSSVEDAERFLPFISINHCKLNSSCVSFELNDILNVFSDYSICFNNIEYKDAERRRELFEYCCKNRNSTNKTSYDFQKIFSLRFSDFELDAIKISNDLIGGTYDK